MLLISEAHFFMLETVSRLVWVNTSFTVNTLLSEQLSAIVIFLRISKVFSQVQ